MKNLKIAFRPELHIAGNSKVGLDYKHIRTYETNKPEFKEPGYLKL